MSPTGPGHRPTHSARGSIIATAVVVAFALWSAFWAPQTFGGGGPNVWWELQNNVAFVVLAAVIAAIGLIWTIRTPRPAVTSRRPGAIATGEPGTNLGFLGRHRLSRSCRMTSWSRRCNTSSSHPDNRRPARIGRAFLIAAVIADQSMRWARATMIPSGPRTYAMRQMCSY